MVEFVDTNKPESTGGHFTMIPNWLIRDSSLSGKELLVYMALVSRADEYGVAWPSIGRIAKEARMSPSTAKRTLSQLEAAHVVTKQIRKRADGTNDSNRYKVELFKTRRGVHSDPLTGSQGTGDGFPMNREEDPYQEDPLEEDSRSNLTVGREHSSSSDSRPMPKSTKAQHEYLSELFIHYNAEIPTAELKATWKALDIEQAKRLIKEYLAKVPRYDAYQGPEEGEPAFAALSAKGKAYAEVGMLPDAVSDEFWKGAVA